MTQKSDMYLEKIMEILSVVSRIDARVESMEKAIDLHEKRIENIQKTRRNTVFWVLGVMLTIGASATGLYKTIVQLETKVEQIQEARNARE